jgi:IS30 family transposase
LSSQVERLNLDWRRSKVLELNSQGYSQPEIAKILQASVGTVNRDLSIIRQQAKDNLQKHIQEKLPQEYQRCLTGLNQVLKTCWYIVNKPNTDDKIKLQATAIINDSYKAVMDLATNASVVSNALTHVNGKAEKLGQQVKAEKDSASKSDSDEEEESSPLVWVDHIDKSKKL